MEIIDVHAHIYPEKIEQKAVEGIGNFYNLAMHQNHGTAKTLIKQGAKMGVNKYLVHSVATVPQQVQTINNFITSECKENPEFIGFGAIHADMENPLDEIERIKDLGLKGLKIHPDTQHFNMDDPKMLEIYSAIEGKLPIAIHCGDYRYDYSHPRRLANVIDNFPNLTIIAAHFGGWSVWDLALEILEDRVKKSNCYFDTSSSMEFLGKRRSYELIKAYSPERMLFGTDFPMWRTKDELEFLQTLPLTSNELEMILSCNAKRVLGL